MFGVFLSLLTLHSLARGLFDSVMPIMLFMVNKSWKGLCLTAMHLFDNADLMWHKKGDKRKIPWEHLQRKRNVSFFPFSLYSHSGPFLSPWLKQNGWTLFFPIPSIHYQFWTDMTAAKTNLKQWQSKLCIGGYCFRAQCSLSCALLFLIFKLCI